MKLAITGYQQVTTHFKQTHLKGGIIFKFWKVGTVLGRSPKGGIIPIQKSKLQTLQYLTSRNHNSILNHELPTIKTKIHSTS